MRKIPLVNGGFTQVDNEDYERLVSMGNWRAEAFRGGKGKPYVVHKTTIKGKTVAYSLHRVILNAPRSLDVDHITGDTLDNRRSNLRLCTKTQNQANRGINKDNTSGYKGVRLLRGHFRNKPWMAYIGYNNKKIYLGLYCTPQEAAQVYNEKAKELFGEFAWLNPI